jgi:hypothetical protein
MNQRTAKLIASYAARTSAKERQLKREWQALSRQQKTKRRLTMKETVK